MRENGSNGFVFPLSSSVALVNDFAVRRDSLDVLPIPLAFALEGDWVWFNRTAQDQGALQGLQSRAANAPAENMQAAESPEAYRRDLPPFNPAHTTPVYNLDGEVVGHLAWSDNAVAAWAAELLDIAVLVAREGKVVWANGAAQQLLTVEVGADWDTLDGFPTWAEMSSAEGIHHIGDFELKCRISGPYVVAQYNQRVATAESSLPMEQVASMVHEIRNPLAALGGYVEMAQMEADANASIYYDRMMREIDRLSRLTSDLMSVSRFPTVNPQWTRLDAVVDNAWLAAFQGQRKHKKVIALKRSYPPDQHVFADPDRLQQVLTNLIKNAVEAMSRTGTEVEVACQAAQDRDLIIVRDDGPGLSEEDLAKLSIKRFTTKKSGNGLGLMIVRRIVRAHGGSMRIVSSGGLMVELSFPHTS